MPSLFEIAGKIGNNNKNKNKNSNNNSNNNNNVLESESISSADNDEGEGKPECNQCGGQFDKVDNPGTQYGGRGIVCSNCSRKGNNELSSDPYFINVVIVV